MSHPPIDPLDGYTPDWRDKLRQPVAVNSNDPLAGYTPNWRSLLTYDFRNETARGRAQVESENLAAQTQKYQQLLERPDLKPEQRKRLEKFIKQNEQGSWTRRPTENRNPVENFTRGVIAGIPKASAGLLDLAGAAANLGWEGSGDKARELARESQAAIDEVFDPQGKAGLAGDVVGQLVGGMAGYGMLTSATARGLLAVLPQASRAAQLIRVAQTGSVLQRVGGQTLIGVPLDAFQAAMMEDATTQDKVKQFLVSTGANALFAGIIPANKLPQLPEAKPLGAPPVDVSPEAAQKAATLGTAPNETTQAEISAKIAAALERQKSMAIQAEAIKQWKTDNPGKKWKELTNVEKKQHIIKYKAQLERVTAEATAKMEPVADAQSQPAQSTAPAPEVAPGLVTADPVREAVQEYAQTGDVSKIQEVATPQPVVSPAELDNRGLIPDVEAQAKDIPDANTNLYQGGISSKPGDAVDTIAAELRQIDSQLADVQKRIESTPDVEDISHDLLNLRNELGRARRKKATELQVALGLVNEDALDFAGLDGSPKGTDNGVLKDSNVRSFLKEMDSWSQHNSTANMDIKQQFDHTGKRDEIINKYAKLIDRDQLFQYLNTVPYKGFWGNSADDWLHAVYQAGQSEHSKQAFALSELVRYIEDTYINGNEPEMGGYMIDGDLLNGALGEGKVKSIENVLQGLSELGDMDQFKRVELVNNLRDQLGEIQGRLSELESIYGKDPEFTEGTNYSYKPPKPSTEDAINQLITETGGRADPIQEAAQLQTAIEDVRAHVDDSPATVEAQLDPPPPTEALVTKMSKPKKVKNFVPPQIPAGQAPHTGAIGYEAMVTLPDGRLQPVEIYNYMISNTNAKTKMYRWRYAGEGDTDWKTSGFSFRDVESDIKSDIAKGGALNPMTQAQIDELQAQVKAGKRPVMPIEKMTIAQLTKHIDKLNDLIDALPPEKVGSPEHQVIEREIQKAAKQKTILGREMASAPTVAEGVGRQAVSEANKLSIQMADLRARMDVSQDPEALKAMQAEYLSLEAQRKNILQGARDTGAIIKDGTVAEVVSSKEAPASIDVSTISPETRAGWFNKSIDEMTPRIMEAHAVDLVEKINGLPRSEAAPYIRRYNALKERYVAVVKRRNNGFLTVNIPPEVGMGVLGFTAGMATGETDEERMRNAFYGLMLGVGAGHGYRKIHMRYETSKIAGLLPGESEIKKYVRTAAEQEGMQKFKPFLGRLEQWYQRIPRPSWSVEKITDIAGGKTLPAHKNPGKLAAMFGRWVSQTEDFIFGRPSMEDDNGMSVILKDVKSVVEIANIADGDTETLGNLMAALTTIEQHATGKVTSPIPLADAIRFANSAPQKFHDAAKEARALNLALIDVLVDAGVIDPAARMAMAQQQWYAPLERIFGNAPKPTNAPPPIGASIGSGMPATNPVKGLGKGKAPHLIANPFETMVGNMPKILRAAERNKAKLSLVQLYHANKDAFEGLMYPAPRSKKANIPAFNAQVASLKQSLQGVSTQTATSMASAFGDVHLDPTSNTMSVWNNGVLETYRLDPYIAESYRALHPEELDLMWDLVGIPARVARRGIVSNPVFLLYQAFRDNWQATMNSQYGFRFGVDWFNGWREAMKNSAEYKQYIARGGGNSLYAQREVLSISKTLKAIRTKGITAEGPALEVAVKQMKSMSFLEAYHTIMTPIAEAARVGEYLRARGHGAPAIEAVYAAKEITGNYSQIAPLIKGLNRATLFLNPAIKAMDQAFYASGLHKWRTPEAGRKAAASRYLTNAFLTLTLPSMMLKLANRDDAEIDELSRSEFGRRFWFIRNPAGGGIIKLPKPQFEGQIFATGVEVAMDAWKEKNPEEFGKWADAVSNDVAMNLLPVMAVLPYSLVANKDLGTGINITPYDKEDVDPELQAGDRTSVAARIVGKGLAPVSTKFESETWRRVLSPAGLDYIAKTLGGTLTTEFLHTLSTVVNWNMKGYLAPAQELPIIRGMLVDYPNNSVKSVEEFYRVANIVDRKMKTFQHLAETEPTRAVDYYNDNKDWINLAEAYASTRKDIAELRQAVEDVSNIPGEGVSPLYKRQLRQEMTRRVIMLASSINQARQTIIK